MRRNVRRRRRRLNLRRRQPILGDLPDRAGHLQVLGRPRLRLRGRRCRPAHRRQKVVVKLRGRRPVRPPGVTMQGPERRAELWVRRNVRRHRRRLNLRRCQPILGNLPDRAGHLQALGRPRLRHRRLAVRFRHHRPSHGRQRPSHRRHRVLVQSRGRHPGRPPVATFRAPTTSRRPYPTLARHLSGRAMLGVGPSRPLRRLNSELAPLRSSFDCDLRRHCEASLVTSFLPRSIRTE